MKYNVKELTLFQLTREFGQTFGWDDSYKELDFESHISISFTIPNDIGAQKLFYQSFPKTPGLFNRKVKAVYRSARQTFRNHWVLSPEVFNTDGSVEQEELMKEMWGHIAPDERICQSCHNVWYECREFPRCMLDIWGFEIG